MQIYIDPIKISEIINYTGNPFSLFWYLLIRGGWLVGLISAAWGIYFAWLEWKRRDHLRNETKYTLFAIDVPKENEQTIKAVEEIFATLHGVKSGKIAKETYILGETQPWINLEIISIEGYIQFLIRTPSKFSDVIKSAFFAHYPDADIIEVEDYMSIIPMDTNNPDSKFKGFGMDFFLGAPNFLPIKTYPEFEHSMSQTYIDPLGSVLELMSKLGPGEFMGFMLMIRPIDGDDVVESGKKEISKMMGRVKAVSKNFADKILDGAVQNMQIASEAIYDMGWEISAEEQATKKDELKILTPGERERIKQIEGKIGRFLYEARLMTLYIAPKEKFLISRGMYGLQGAMRQFANFNSFKNKKTKADYIYKIDRERKNVQAFIKKFVIRDTFNTKPFVLSTEEVASIYHFPDQNVKAPMIKKTDTKTVEPPTEIPFETQKPSILFTQNQKNLEVEQLEKEYIEQNLNDGTTIDLNLDDKYFESKFAKHQKDRQEAQREFEEDLRKENKRLPEESTMDDSDEDRIKPPDNLPFVD